MAKENREFKDSVFTDLFYSDEDAKENLLSIYNALYGTSYNDSEVIEKVRLEDVFFKNFRNDIAFKVKDKRIVLGEHQSTPNPNMPLRNLMYIGREYEKIVPSEKRYRSSLIKIPTPEFITFYNGTEEQPDEQILRLSDAFVEKDEIPSLELTMRVLNINYGHNREFLGKCRVLREYSTFVETTRKYKSDKNALEKSIKECIEKGVLKEYLQRKSGEVINMLMAEYDYEMDIKVQREEAAEEAAERAREAVEKAQKEAQDAKEQVEIIKKKAAETEHNEKIETAKRMIKMGQFTSEIIAQASGLSVEEVNALLAQK